MIHNSTAEIMDKNKIEAEIGKFLSSGNLPHKEHIPYKGNQEIGTIGKWVVPEVLHNITTLTPTELRKKYPRSYKCWDNMKQRKHKGQSFILSSTSLLISYVKLDPARTKTTHWTDSTMMTLSMPLEKLNGVINLPKTQTREITSTSLMMMVESVLLLNGLKITKQKPSTLYKRHKAGWSDMEIITGKKFELYTPQAKTSGHTKKNRYGRNDIELLLLKMALKIHALRFWNTIPK